MYKDIKIAYDMADKVYLEYIGGTVVSEEDKAIIKKYVDLGIIAMTKVKKRNFGKKLYFPTIEAEEFRGLSMLVWLNINRAMINKYEIASQLGKASMGEYVSKSWQYNIEPVVVNKTAAGSLQMKEEAAALQQVLDEDKNNYVIIT